MKDEQLKSKTLVLFTAAILASIASGCSEKSPGTPTSPTTTGAPTQTTAAGKSAFPEPELDPKRFADRPCDLLKPAQLAELGEFDAPEPDNGAIGPSCGWGAKDVLKGTRYDITIYDDGSTIDTIIESVEGSPVVKETEISGYPAVSYDITDGKGTCSTAVGTSSVSAILVQVLNENEESSEWKDSCGASEKVAATVIGNLKG
ncbi:DUF3558 domain-containing protein [Saccharothrix coeruleofusca]|uniref:DUF3558 domain-containing protein n=1 Tax=Saccharothrix coeruleofusca TaxID=33919 RepID=A0A918EBV0_9PSEU|nr:DUF3558 domain-containing protein [Saccharothrix coeruleofusca]MBP2333885.1 hypothetical protein [Saccharothrix coeruleofusca]GGP44981.1 hypothetical protein GCM10010185_15960 [Saccharothrix coeruleofusca]